MASKSVGQVTRGHIPLWLASLMDSVRVTLTRWQNLYGPTGCRESSRLMSIDLLLVVLSFHINHHHWFFLIKFTAGVNLVYVLITEVFDLLVVIFIPPFTVIQLKQPGSVFFELIVLLKVTYLQEVSNVIPSWKSLKDLWGFSKIIKIH